MLSVTPWWIAFCKMNLAQELHVAFCSQVNDPQEELDMNSGMYAALTGSMASLQRMETLTNNLAYANNNGYKKDRVAFEAVLASVDTATTSAAVLDQTPVHPVMHTMIDFSDGVTVQTGGMMDFALEGDGFFEVNTPDGKAYTRQGNFHRDATGKLLSAQGFEVLSNGRPLTIQGNEIEVSKTGEVTVDGNKVGTIDVLDFPKPYALQRAGSNTFTPIDPEVVPTKVSKPILLQGAMERSNVNPIIEMTHLLEVARHYESCIKAVKSYDDMAAKASNDLGKV